MPDESENRDSPQSAWQFFAENFAAISGVTVFAGLVLSTIFLSSYLTVFDWHLLWFVQSADVVTFGLLAAGIGASSLSILQGIFQGVFFAKGDEKKQAWSDLYIVLGVISLLFLIGVVVQLFWAAVPHYIPILFAWAATVSFGTLVGILAIYVRARMWPQGNQLVGFVFMAVTATITFGQWLGHSVQDSPRYMQDIEMKDYTISSAKLVIAMSRYTIILKDKALYVVPTDEIKQFKSIVASGNAAP